MTPQSQPSNPLIFHPKPLIFPHTTSPHITHVPPRPSTHKHLNPTQSTWAEKAAGAPDCRQQSRCIQRRPNLDSSWLPRHIHVTHTMTHPPHEFQPLQPPWHAPTGTWQPAAGQLVSGQVHPIYPRPKLGTHVPHNILQHVAASHTHPTRPWDPPSQNCFPASTVFSALRAVLGLTRPKNDQKCWKSNSLQVSLKALVFKRVIRGPDLATGPKSSVLEVLTTDSDSPWSKTKSWVLGPT
jgi:hypothetical protein